jgi:hypothetical protein
MYATKPVNGIPAIQRNGQIVLSVCNQDWEFADWLCSLLNELGRKPPFLLMQRNMALLEALNASVMRHVHNA